MNHMMLDSVLLHPSILVLAQAQEVVVAVQEVPLAAVQVPVVVVAVATAATRDQGTTAERSASETVVDPQEPDHLDPMPRGLAVLVMLMTQSRQYWIRALSVQ